LVQDFDDTKERFGVIAEHPELLDINAAGGMRLPADWNHVNSVAYNADLDQLVLSSHHQDEIWIIDHSTTSAEAAGSTGGASGRGGDLLYRWGNPAMYDSGTVADQTLNGQHDARWIPEGRIGAGNLLIFNNRAGEARSEVVEIAPPWVDGAYLLEGDAYGPVEPAWIYSESLYSRVISGAERLPNGNTLICEGTRGRFIEVTREGEVVWEYINPVAGSGPLDQGTAVDDKSGLSVFRVIRLPADHPAFRDLEPGEYIEGP
jgi:hypothetical protein